jgi:hypothetical protein
VEANVLYWIDLHFIRNVEPDSEQLTNLWYGLQRHDSTSGEAIFHRMANIWPLLAEKSDVRTFRACLCNCWPYPREYLLLKLLWKNLTLWDYAENGQMIDIIAILYRTRLVWYYRRKHCIRHPCKMYIYINFGLSISRHRELRIVARQADDMNQLLKLAARNRNKEGGLWKLCLEVNRRYLDEDDS